MNLKIYILLASILMLGVSTNYAQKNTAQRVSSTATYHKCASHENLELLERQNPNAFDTEAFENWISQEIERRKNAGEEQRATYNIPIVVHVVHNGSAAQNISQAQVMSQIRVLNEDYNRTNPDASSTRAIFQSVAGSMDIEFVPAVVDPMGNPLAEPGINRVNGQAMFGVSGWSGPGGTTDTQLKPNTIWDPTQYFNLWCVNFSSASLLGYAQFPQSNIPGNLSNSNATTDGVVIGYRFFGSNFDANGVQNNNFALDGLANKGRTTTHEVGHWMGLRHIWGDTGCGGDDFVTDTPLQGASSPFAANCNFNLNTCTTTPTDQPDQLENYMDYSGDGCMNMFTIGQVDRMVTIMTTAPRRIELLTSTTGQDQGNILAANFDLVANEGCGPVTGTFTDESTAGTNINPINSWSWNFDVNGLGGASPSTFNGQTPPTVTFSNTGTYTIELTATNGTETNTTTNTVSVTDVILENNLNGGGLIALASDQSGFIGGHNNYDDAAKAEYFGSLTNGEMLSSADFFFHEVGGAANTPVTFNIWDNTGAGGFPGSIIATTTLNVGQIAANDWTRVDFPDITISGPIYIGYELSYTNGTSLAVATNSDGETVPTTAYERWSDGDWYPFNDGTGSNTTWELDVALAITANFECPNLSAPPVADFEANDVSVCSGTAVNFTDLSTGVPTSWAWDFGDGNSSTMQNPSNTYTMGGTYTVSLTVSNTDGMDSETKTNYITVQTEPANFTGNASVNSICAGESVNLSMSGTFGAAYSWEENGNVIASSANTSVSPTTTTTYTAICDNGTCRVTDEVTITVYALPTVSITANMATLTAVSATATNWQWSDGNGIISGATSSTYTATASGVYTVEIADINGCAVISGPFTLSLDPPMADFSASVVEICQGESVSFTDASTNSPTSWAWDFGDGNSSTMQNPSNIYTMAGDFTVALTATNSFGDDTETKMMYITVQAQPTGFVGMASESSVCPGATVDLSMSGTFSASYSWSEGSTQIATGPNTTVNPTATTTYTALCDNGVCSATSDVTVTVLTPGAAPTIAQNGFDLTATGTAPFQWYLNGNAISGETGATYTATADGNYTVSGTDANGCTTAQSAMTTISNTAVFDETLNAAISIYPNPVYNVLNIEFSNSQLGKLSIELIDVTGRLLQQENVNATISTIDMTNLAPGVYMVRVRNDDGGFAVREIVKY